ncbi:right-handed parallel beta-helix repeat-containing protein [Myxococcota bacterium]|nr:right-handed parallel beta-helix repeat-containing protein [Myxococcota bacterium]
MRASPLALLLGLAVSLPLLPACGLFGDKDPGDDGDDGTADGGGTDGGSGDGGATTGDQDGDGYTVAEGDCDDLDPWANPGETEWCDDIDNDCDDVVDEGDAVDARLWFADADDDGFGDAANTTMACEEPEGFTDDDRDCDDSDPLRNPDQEEVCDERDNDCDLDIDEGVTVTLYRDDDGDGHGDPTVTRSGCVPMGVWVADGTDCDDTQDTRYPGADEYCDDVDNDCDDLVDEDAVDGDWYAPDADGDGMGQADGLAWLCEGVTNAWDCDDDDPAEPQVVDADSIWTGADGSLEFPHQSLQDGIDAATGCVVAMPGTYAEAIDFGGRDLDVWGVEGADETIIDASGLGAPAVTFQGGETPEAVLRGFTVQGGEGLLEEESVSTKCHSSETCTDYYQTWCGGGLFVDGADPTLQDLVITANDLPEQQVYTSGNDTYYVYSFGGGACLLSTSAVFLGVTFAENFADQGGALYVDDLSAVELTQSALFENTATDGAAIQVAGGSLVLSNVLGAWNDATGDGGALLLIDGELDGTNLTIAQGSASTGAGLYISGSSSAALRNSIVASNSTEGILVDAGASYLGSYDDVYGNGTNYSGITDATGVSGNISEDPLFTSVSDNDDWSDDDWSLQATSPAVDAGDPGAAYRDPDGSVNDMGAYGGPDGDW